MYAYVPLSALPQYSHYGPPFLQGYPQWPVAPDPSRTEFQQSLAPETVQPRPQERIEQSGLSRTRRQHSGDRPRVSVQPYSWQPAVNLFEYDRSWLVEVEVPGTDEDQLSITWEDGALLVEGELEPYDPDHVYYQERRSGSFGRRVFIPREVEAEEAEATYRRGVLEILIPKPKHRELR
jgi:HSP20 family molecular chaperone IbpA